MRRTKGNAVSDRICGSKDSHVPFRLQGGALVAAVNEPSSQSWQKLSSQPRSQDSQSWVQMPRETSLTSTLRCQSVHPSRFPAASKGQWLSRKVALWNSPSVLSCRTTPKWPGRPRNPPSSAPLPRDRSSCHRGW